jgi:alpha-glucosidase (family GH31 glycosyl hydrolase)
VLPAERWFDARTGAWLRGGRRLRVQCSPFETPLYVRAGSLLFVLKDDADLIVTRSGPKGFETVRTYTMADTATWAEPVVSGNRLFVKDVASLALWTLP